MVIETGYLTLLYSKRNMGTLSEAEADTLKAFEDARIDVNALAEGEAGLDAVALASARRDSVFDSVFK